MLSLLRFVPKNHLSFLVGAFANLRLPAALNRRLLTWYCRRYGVAMDEFTGSIDDYPSLGLFFQRDLKPGLRPIEGSVVSPVDGRVDEFGTIHQGLLVQAKGKKYRLDRLLGDSELAKHFEGGTYVTIYLAPGDYHHIHSPIDGRIVKACHIPGNLWPVNPWSVATIPELFTVNERITTILESDVGLVAVVKVGATNVGSITTSYNSFVGNKEFTWFTKDTSPRWQSFEEPIVVERGQRLGSFRMGSTVILLFESGVLAETIERGPIRLGAALPRA